MVLNALLASVTGPSKSPAALSKKEYNFSISSLFETKDISEKSNMMLQQELQKVKPVLSAFPLQHKYNFRLFTLETFYNYAVSNLMYLNPLPS